MEDNVFRLPAKAKKEVTIPAGKGGGDCCKEEYNQMRRDT